MKIRLPILATLLIVNTVLLSYLFYNYREQVRQIEQLQLALDTRLDLVKSFSAKEDFTGTSLNLIIPKDINDSNIIWVKIKVDDIKNLKQFTIVK